MALTEGFVGTEAQWLASLIGPEGADGREVELQKTATHVQWRYVGTTPWTNLIPLADISGTNGQNVELGKSATHIQWRVVGSTTWIDLVALADLKGDAGAPGSDATVNATTVAAVLHGATEKTSPADADEFPLVDSAAGNALKKLTWANAKAALLAYFKGQFRERLSAPRTYYVRTDGNDSNTGLANTAGGAFLTIQKAVDTASMLDNGGNQITINVANGTYGSFLLRSYVGSQAPMLVGNTDTPGNVVISATGTAIGCIDCGAWNLAGMRVQSSSGAGLSCVGAGTLVTLSGSFEFGACASQHMICTDDARLNIACPWRIAGNAVAHINTVRGASILAFAQTCTIVGTIALNYFVYAETASDILIQSVTFTGTLTGKRYEVTLNAVVQTYGGGVSYFPGNSAGTVSTGGQYA